MILRACPQFQIRGTLACDAAHVVLDGINNDGIHGADLSSIS